MRKRLSMFVTSGRDSRIRLQVRCIMMLRTLKSWIVEELVGPSSPVFGVRMMNAHVLERILVFL
ncbi:hypothetical protein APY94_05060 [Thermococcus celericrescens]|uniref:Uncharacterized protein n=1 Tax=Thermococcus celericrescens TaxID=227598 RepID=A0A117ITE7_9EURY|nr:hypothetical protein APY94_05060 [Thermococcus celericrescens]